MNNYELPTTNYEFDRKHLWHPYTSATNPDNVYEITHAIGCEIFFAGKDTPIVDAMSSWWSAIHGYSHPALVEAIKTQVSQMSHIMFGGLTHEPAIELGKKILSLLPRDFNNIFFADSGSVSVEVAMKTAIQFQYNNNFPRKNKFLTFLCGYHGDTAGAMSVCDPVTGMHSLFSDSIQKQFFVPAPILGFERDIQGEDLENLEKSAKENCEQIAAVILEPIVQGAGGMRIYSPKYLEEIRKICDKFGFLLIFDEIATGFGRTGKMFAFEHARNCIPDIICVGKALTGGMMTLAAMVTTENVAKIACKNGTPLMHGPTFMANPLACSAALANLNLLTSWNWHEKVKFIENYLKKTLGVLKNNPKVADIRVIGAIGVVEMKEKIDGARFQADCIAAGAWLRPFGKLAYIMPPYIISQKQLETVVEAIKFAVENH